MMRFYVLVLPFHQLVHLLNCCWAQINGKKKKTSLFRDVFIAFYYCRMAERVFLLYFFLLKIIEIDMFNNTMGVQQLMLKLKLKLLSKFIGLESRMA